MPASEYRYIIAEVIYAPHEKSERSIRARPLPKQWAGPEYRIECPTEIRKMKNVGELYKFYAKFKDTFRAPHLYTSYHWLPTRVTPAQARTFIAKKGWL